MPAANENQRLVVGVMTGTSIDGIDAALVRIRGVGLDMQAELVRHISRPLGDIGTRLRAAAQQQPMSAGEFATLAWEFGELHGRVIDELLATLPLPLGEGRGERAHESSKTFGSTLTPAPTPNERGEVHLICVHGQTVFHQPPISWQLVNPAPIAARFKCAVVSDLRQADLAAGGQGAPITPMADWVLFRDATTKRAIVNLGGFCNVTIVPRHEGIEARNHEGRRAGASSPPAESCLDQIRGFDVCACNQILDAVARKVLGKAFDKDGEQASRGRAKPQATEELLAILERQRRGGRSLGTGDEAVKWVDEQLKANLSSADLAATAVDGIARCIGAAVCEHQTDEIILAGGGARNRALIKSIEIHAQVPIRLSDELGVPIEARESVCFAILGALCADGVPITLPQVTSCAAPAPVGGCHLNAHASAR